MYLYIYSFIFIVLANHQVINFTYTHTHMHVHPSGIALILAPLFHSYFRQPFGFILALLCAFFGFFFPLTRHRIPHVVGWQNPTMLGGLFLGVLATVLCYFIEIFPNILLTFSLTI